MIPILLVATKIRNYLVLSNVYKGILAVSHFSCWRLVFVNSFKKGSIYRK